MSVLGVAGRFVAGVLVTEAYVLVGSVPGGLAGAVVWPWFGGCGVVTTGGTRDGAAGASGVGVGGAVGVAGWTVGGGMVGWTSVIGVGR